MCASGLWGIGMSVEQDDWERRVRELENELREIRASSERTAEEHERTVRVLQSRAAMFEKAFRGSPDAVNVSRISDGVYILINPGFTDLTGYDEAEVLGSSSLHMDIWANPEDRDRLVSGLNAEGTVRGLLAPFRLKNGTVATGLLSASIIELDGVPCILSITRDISDRIRAEQATARSEEQLRNVIEFAVDGIALWDADGCIIEVNQRCCEMAGAPREKLMGRHLSTVFTPESVEKAPMRFDLIAQGSRVVAEREIARSDGTAVPVEVSSIRMPNGTHQTFVRDLTERKRAERERAAMQERLRRTDRNEALGQLAGGIAHDLNNLLTPILAGATILLQKHTIEPDVRGEVETIADAGRRAAELTRQILAFSRQQVLTVRSLDLNDDISKTMHMLRRVIGEDVEVVLRLERDLPKVLADASQVQQVLLNLAINARDAMPNGGRIDIKTSMFECDATCSVQASGLKPGLYARLDVADTGNGMEPETLRHAFEPFFTTKPEGQGTGLGLATVSGIVQQHGGAVWATSLPGKGTTVTICLPMGGEPAESSAGQPAPLVPRGNGETILLVEDDPLVHGVARRILEGAGYAVVSARDPHEALRAANVLGHPPDLLVTDLVMPGMYGNELVEQLRRRFERLRVLFVSGYPDAALGPHGVLPAGVHFLNKPFSAVSLLSAVRTGLDREPS
jgi:two-component system, cell cycle sensor histidine kinase and response regulator CckA